VLAFPLVEPFMVQPGDLLGDVVLCPAVAVERAVSEGRSGEREILELVVHGVLHLIGYDHATDEERGIMFDLQERVLSELGV
jgi:probable rRNA maturation factor